MYDIVSKEHINEYEGVRITRIVVKAPLIATKAAPGQFVIFMVSHEGERVPLTIVDSDKKKGTITIIFQEAGLSTKLLGTKEPGDCLYSIVGPLGHPAEIKDYGHVCIVAGGVGIAEILPISRAYKAAGNKVSIILGVRTKELLILEEDLRHYADNMLIATDDGSLGTKGFVTTVLSNILKQDEKIDFLYCVGPVPMMNAVADLTKDEGFKTVVCLNAIMIDGTGMCGSCRLTYDGKIKFCCVDGPDFDAALVDWKELMTRQKRFVIQEKEALEFHKTHICHLDKYCKEL